MAHPLSSPDISIFYRKSANFAISGNTDIDYISNSFLTFLSLFDKQSYNFDDVSKIDYSRPF